MDRPVLDPPGICVIAAIELAGSLPDCPPLFSVHLAGNSRRALVLVDNLDRRVGPEVVIPAGRALLPEASPDDGKIAGKGNAQQGRRTGPPGARAGRYDGDDRDAATTFASVTWPLLSRRKNLSRCGPDLANNQAPGRDDETCHIARCAAFGAGTSYASAWMSPIRASLEAAADAPPAQGDRSTPLIIPLTRQATSSCAGRGELAPALSTGHACQICTAAVQVSIEPVPAPNDGTRAPCDRRPHQRRPPRRRPWIPGYPGRPMAPASGQAGGCRSPNRLPNGSSI